MTVYERWLQWRYRRCWDRFLRLQERLRASGVHCPECCAESLQDEQPPEAEPKGPFIG